MFTGKGESKQEFLNEKKHTQAKHVWVELRRGDEL